MEAVATALAEEGLMAFAAVLLYRTLFSNPSSSMETESIGDDDPQECSRIHGRCGLLRWIHSGHGQIHGGVGSIHGGEPHWCMVGVPGSQLAAAVHAGLLRGRYPVAEALGC